MKQENPIKPHNRSAHSKMCIIRTLQSISTDQHVHSYQQLNLTYFKETSFLLILTFKGIFRDHPLFNIIKKLASIKKKKLLVRKPCSEMSTFRLNGILLNA